MGLVNAKIQSRNPRRPELEAVEIDALADTGPVHLCIPQHINIQLGLEEKDTKEVVLADGSRKVVPYVGPVELPVRESDRVRRRVGHGRRTLVGRHPDGGHGSGRRAKDQTGRRQSALPERCLVRCEASPRVGTSRRPFRGSLSRSTSCGEARRPTRGGRPRTICCRGGIGTG